MKIPKNWFRGHFEVKIDVDSLVTRQATISTGDKIIVDTGFEKVEGEFVRETDRSFAGSQGEYKTPDGKIHIYDEFCHTVTLKPHEIVVKTEDKQLDIFTALIVKHKNSNTPFDYRLFSNDESASQFLTENIKKTTAYSATEEDYELVAVRVIPLLTPTITNNQHEPNRYTQGRGKRV